LEILCGFLILRAGDETGVHSSVRYHHDGDCDNKDSRVVSRQPGFLVHG
jgi:hypothetical protein